MLGQDPTTDPPPSWLWVKAGRSPTCHANVKVPWAWGREGGYGDEGWGEAGGTQEGRAMGESRWMGSDIAEISLFNN